MHRFVKFIILFLPILSLAQIEVYIDDDNNEIDSIGFYKKCNAKVLNCLKYRTDSLIVNKIHNRYKFGEISKQESKQIRSLLKKNSSTEITPDLILVIKNTDSIGRNYQSYLNYKRRMASQNKLGINSNPNRRNKESKLLTENQLDKINKSLLRRLKKCTSSFDEKINTKVFFTYKYVEFRKEKLKKINLIKDQEAIMSTFLNKVHNGDYVIIRPNGQYFISSRLLPKLSLLTLIKSKDWSIHKNDLELSKIQNLKIGNGIFRTVISINENINFCF